MMKFYLSSILSIILLTNLNAQNISASEVLDKSIAFHDPQGNWPSFKGVLQVTMETPKGSPRQSMIRIDLPNESFQLLQYKDSVKTTYGLDKQKCTTSLTDSIAGKRTPCEMATLYKDYYTYLYGLPMKLKDLGAKLDPKVAAVTFKGKEYLKLRVDYTAEVGSDIWYFYFDPNTYAMEVYQFFKSENGKMKMDSGEYILLSELKEIDNIKFPKKRAWYYNKQDGYLGTDILK